MENWEDLPLYWSTLQLTDLLAIVWIIFIVLFIIDINVLFTSFIEIKHAGRKTVIGKICQKK